MRGWNDDSSLEGRTTPNKPETKVVKKGQESVNVESGRFLSYIQRYREKEREIHRRRKGLENSP